MPIITVKVIEGRTTEQKRGLVKDITDAVVNNFKVKPDEIMIDIIDYSRENIAVAGKLIADRIS